jgi:hypothetical protein
MRSLVVVVVACLAVAGRAEADSVSYSRFFDVYDSVFALDVSSGYSVSLFDSAVQQVPRFDPTLGTLQAVSVSIDSSYQSILSIDATDERGEFDLFPLPPIAYNHRNDTFHEALLNASFTVQLLEPNSFTPRSLSANTLGAFCEQSKEDYDGASSSADDVFCNRITSLMFAFDDTVPLGGLGVSDFVGLDPLDVFFQMRGTVTGNCDSNDIGDVCNVRPSTQVVWSGDVIVTYTYAPDGGGDGGGGGPTVPEPGATLLVAGALGASGLRRLRGRKGPASVQ